MMEKIKIISGGQTGIDRMALDVARELEIQTGGTAPKGFWTETGPDLSLKEFGLTEHAEFGYLPRTKQNVFDSDGTVLYGDMNSPGSKTTIEFCVALSKPYVVNPSPDEFTGFLTEHQVKILNVAGNRASKLSVEKLLECRETFKNSVQKLVNRLSQQVQPISKKR